MDLKIVNSELLAEVTDAKLKLEEADKRLADVEASKMSLELQVEELSAKVSTLDGEIRDAEDKLEKFRGECENLKEENTSLVNVTKSLEHNCENLKSDNAIMKKTCEQNEVEKKTLVEKYNKLERQAARMEQKLIEEEESFRNRVENSETVQHLRVTVSKLQDKIRKLEKVI